MFLDLSQTPYVVLVGDVGAGKSTLVEKVTGLKGRSSGKGTSFTRKASYALSTDDSLLISDTPGVNVTSDKFAQNVWIAQALNLQPVSQIFITVKADTRMENVIDRVKEYSSKFVALNKKEALGLVVTNMDNREIDWTESLFCEHLKQSNIPISNTIFSMKDTPGMRLIELMHNKCKNTEDGSIKQFDMDIDSENFHKMFKPSQSDRLINDAIMKEKKRMALACESFFEVFDRLDQETEKMDLLFEFQHWAASEMTEAQKRVAGDMQHQDEAELLHRLDFLKDVLTTELHKVKKRAEDFNKKYHDAVFRSCPVCERVWTKAEGCDGATRCGMGEVHASDKHSSLASFSFEWIDLDKCATPRFKITKKGDVEAARKALEAMELRNSESVTFSLSKYTAALTSPKLELLLDNQSYVHQDEEYARKRECVNGLTFPGLDSIKLVERRAEDEREKRAKVTNIRTMLKSLRLENLPIRVGEQTGQTKMRQVNKLAEALASPQNSCWWWWRCDLSPSEKLMLEEAVRKRQEEWEALSEREKAKRTRQTRREMQSDRAFHKMREEARENWVKLSYKEKEEKLEAKRIREEKREKERLEGFKNSGRKGCGARIVWKEMKPLPTDKIPADLIWSPVKVERLPEAVKAYENKFHDFTSQQKPRMEAIASSDEETVTFYVIPTPRGVKNMDDMKTKVNEIALNGLTWEGIREVPYSGRKAKTQLKLAVRLKGPDQMKNQLAKAIEAIGNSKGTYVHEIEALGGDEEENLDDSEEEEDVDQNWESIMKDVADIEKDIEDKEENKEFWRGPTHL